MTRHDMMTDTTCPTCHGDDVHGGPVTVDNLWMWQDMSCPRCDTTWTDEYRLVRHGNIDTTDTTWKDDE